MKNFIYFCEGEEKIIVRHSNLTFYIENLYVQSRPMSPLEYSQYFPIKIHAMPKIYSHVDNE